MTAPHRQPVLDRIKTNAEQSQSQAEPITMHIPPITEYQRTPLQICEHTIRKLNRTIAAYEDLRTQLVAMNLKSNVLQPGDKYHVHYDDSTNIPEWIKGVDAQLNQLRAKLAVFKFNAGDPCDFLPMGDSTLSPDFDLRSITLKERGHDDASIRHDLDRLRRTGTGVETVFPN